MSEKQNKEAHTCRVPLLCSGAHNCSMVAQTASVSARALHLTFLVPFPAFSGLGHFPSWISYIKLKIVPERIFQGYRRGRLTVHFDLQSCYNLLGNKQRAEARFAPHTLLLLLFSSLVRSPFRYSTVSKKRLNLACGACISLSLGC